MDAFALQQRYASICAAIDGGAARRDQQAGIAAMLESDGHASAAIQARLLLATMDTALRFLRLEKVELEARLAEAGAE
jgi:hypothetical protein